MSRHLSSTVQTDGDAIDLVEVGRSIRRGWRLVVAGLVTGVLGAAGVLLFVPARFTGTSSIVVRNPEAGTKGLMSKLAGSASGGGVGGVADLLPGGLSTPPIETEIQILSSRSLAGEVVDSLLLQARVRGGPRTAPWRMFKSVNAPGSFKKYRLHFETIAGTGSIAVAGTRTTSDTARGGTVRLASGSLQLDTSRVSERFDADVYDREEAITRFEDRLKVGKLGGEVVGITFRADDSLTSAEVPNLLVRRYLARRKSGDRGINQQRVEFLEIQVDSVEASLVAAEQGLRRHQESTGVVDPVIVGKLELENAGELRKQSGLLDVERGAIGQLLAQLADGTLSSRQLAALPTFLRSPGINELLGQLSTLDTKRFQLLATLTADDPAVVAAADGIKQIEAQLPPLARAYAASLDRQRADVGRQLDTLRGSIALLPAVSETGLRLQRNVLRLGQVNAALRAQLVEARLAAVGEGGDVRLLDVAAAPRRVSFPRPIPTFAVGVAGGLIVGIIFAVVGGVFGRYVPDTRSIERHVGVPALTFEPGLPLLVAGGNDVRTLLLVPLDTSADTAGVAERLVRTATTRSLRATVVDHAVVPSREARPVPDIDRLEAEFDLVVVRLPELASEVTVAALRDNRSVLLVATAGRIDRDRLTLTVETLQRLSVPCAGVVVSRHAANGVVRA